MKFTASIASVRRALNSPLPGEEAQYKMAPVQRKSKSEYLSKFPEHRMSSILILLYPDQNNEMQTVLIKRPDNQGAHSGQIAFPGGKLEPGETPEQAALREANEEVGVPVSQVELAGGLTSLFIPVSKFLVNPFVGIIEEAPGFVPNPDEVTMLLPTPVETILKLPVGETAVQTSYGALKTPYYDLNGHIIWGATAMIISEFRELLKSRV